ncbi:DUF6588 family protein, partial [Bacteroidota bacterium]
TNTMKKKLNKIIGLLLVQSIFLLNINAQTEIASFQLGSLDSYFSSYFQPFATATAVSMGGGWYNTAKTHKLIGVDISLLALSLTTVNDEDLLIDPADISLGSGLSLSSTTDIPTLSAEDGLAGPTLRQTIDVPVLGPQTEDVMELFSGKGVGMSAALNMFQIGIGLPKGTDLKIRFIPTIELKVSDDLNFGKVSMFGVGVQHDIKQWIPVVKEVPILQMSVVIGYSKFKMEYTAVPFPFTPELFEATTSLAAATWDDQYLGIDMSSLIVNAVVGINIPVVNPYVGFGLNKYNFDGGLKGTYPILSFQADNLGNVTQVVEDTELDPITITSNGTMMNVNAGLRIKLAVITLWGQYTVQKYPMATVGLGLSIR